MATPPHPTSITFSNCGDAPVFLTAALCRPGLLSSTHGYGQAMGGRAGGEAVGMGLPSLSSLLPPHLSLPPRGGGGNEVLLLLPSPRSASRRPGSASWSPPGTVGQGGTPARGSLGSGTGSSVCIGEAVQGQGTGVCPPCWAGKAALKASYLGSRTFATQQRDPQRGSCLLCVHLSGGVEAAAASAVLCPLQLGRVGFRQ